jgi:hypothetical protein
VKIIQLLTTVQGRLVTGIILIAMVVKGLWPDHPPPVDPAGVVEILGAALAWLFAELAGMRPPSKHDIELFDEFTDKIPQRIINFLRDHDFGASFHNPGVEGIYDVSSWQGSRFEFLDDFIQKKWNMTHANIVKFANLFALNTSPVHDSIEWLTVHPTMGDPENPEPHIAERIQKLNNAATELANEIDQFERLARKRLNL